MKQYLIITFMLFIFCTMFSNICTVFSKVSRMGIYGAPLTISPHGSGDIPGFRLDEFGPFPSKKTKYIKVLSKNPEDVIVQIGSKSPIPLQKALSEGKVSIFGVEDLNGSSNRDKLRIFNNTDYKIVITTKKFTALGVEGHSPYIYDVSVFKGMSQDDILKEQRIINKEIKRIEIQKLSKAGQKQFEDLNQDMIMVAGGTFTMDPIEGGNSQSVTLSSFFICKYEVTQALWALIMNDNPSFFKGSRKPVETITWLEAVEFCNRLSKKSGLNPCYTIRGEKVTCDFSKNGYRLPTEAEWEFAARGGNQSKGYKYSGSNNIDEVAWYGSNSGSKTHKVGTKAPNELGIFDMSGNVYELCWKFALKEDINTSDVIGYKLKRGGCWVYIHGVNRFVNFHQGDYCLMDFRLIIMSDEKSQDTGFRVARTYK